MRQNVNQSSSKKLQISYGKVGIPSQKKKKKKWAGREPQMDRLTTPNNDYLCSLLKQNTT